MACMLVTGVANPSQCSELDVRLEEIELRLRDRYAGRDRAGLRRSAPFAAYERYYKQFGQTYHVWRQVESVAMKGKPIPRRAALVEAAFAEELASGILTALHDADQIGEAIVADIAQGDEIATLYNSNQVALDKDDMYMRDATGVLSSVVRGPAAHGLVTPATSNVVVAIYAPELVDIELVDRHLDAIVENFRLIAPAATVAVREVISA